MLCFFFANITLFYFILNLHCEGPVWYNGKKKGNHHLRNNFTRQNEARRENGRKKYFEIFREFFFKTFICIFFFLLTSDN